MLGPESATAQDAFQVPCTPEHLPLFIQLTYYLCYRWSQMIAELSPQLYDVHGRRIFHPGGAQRRVGFRPTFPMGRYLTEPLKIRCADFGEMRKFLATYRPSLLGRSKEKDYWQLPEEFEVTRTGHCVDFALWSWRQVLAMGYPARLTGGKSGKFGEGHAWVTFEKDGKFYLLEPQMWVLGLRMPRIATLRYHPAVSAEWDGEKVSYFLHGKRNAEPPLRELPVLVGEWLLIWIPVLIKVIPRIPLVLVRKIFRSAAKRQSGSK